MQTLTEQILAYQESGIGYERLSASVATLVYNYPRRCYGFSEDDRGEFLLFFYPRIPSLIKRFHPMGKPFEVYLKTTLRWQLKTYAVRKRRANHRDRVFGRRELWTEMLGDPVRLPSGVNRACDGWRTLLAAQRDSSVEQNGRLRDRSLRKRLLLAAMKSSIELAPGDVEDLARLTGASLAEIRHHCEALRLLASPREARYQLLSARRNKTFVRMQCLQEEVQETPDGERLDILRFKYKKLERRFERARMEATAVLRTPTHREIARTLGVPKGSVDSGIFYLRCALENRRAFPEKINSGMLSQ